jgi:hypothetical protein
MVSDKMKRYFIAKYLTIFLFLTLATNSIADERASARKQLAEMKIAYTKDSLMRAIVVSLLLLTGCSTALQSPNVASNFDCGKEVPAGKIVVNNKSQYSKIGGYCWKEKGCIEPIAWPSSAVPLKSKSPINIKLELPDISPMTHLEYLLVSVSEKNAYRPKDQQHASKFDGSTARWQSLEDGSVTQITPKAKQDIALALKPGTYLITMFGWWKSCGDATHGFLVQIEE